MKRVLTIQDISCLGKCSMTVALPLISAMGVETVILPTAVLSTHTLFSNVAFTDLTSQIRPITEHWKREGIRFDLIYTGYLGTEEEIEIVREVIHTFRTENTFVVIDPVMGDHGRLYRGFDENYARKNAALCGEADLILPNITEACFMTGMEYQEKYDEAYIRELLLRLSGLGAGISVLTGVSLSEGRTGVMGYDAETGESYLYQNEQVPAVYHGTGDIFSSVLSGGLMNGLSWKAALALAADYTARTIDVSRTSTENPWYGVEFERTIPELVRMLEEKKRNTGGQ